MSKGNENPTPTLPEGLYDQLMTPSLRAQLAHAIDQGLVTISPVDVELWPYVRNTQVSRVLAPLLDRIASLETDPEAWRNELTELLEKQTGHLPDGSGEALLAILSSNQKLAGISPTRPDTPLAISALLTGSSRTPSLASQLSKELASADRVDWLVSFIKWSGLRPLLERLETFTRNPAPTEDGIRLRVATTSYMGASDFKAIETLANLPNTEVRFSYDTRRTRLHAKAYMFHRRSGFGSAYIGSANVSKAALDEGLEWTAKVSQQELPHVWAQACATFESNWEDQQAFESCRAEDLSRVRKALQQEQSSTQPAAEEAWFDLRPYPFQEAILQDIADERAAGCTKHLVIAATGTGKTMVAAFDYSRLCKESGRRPRLLFVAHREEILKQALTSYRHVLRDGSFGELLTGQYQPSQMDHLFCTVQSWNSRKLSELPQDYYEVMVLDEAHHATATSYQRLLDHAKPKTLLGLTATPERSDGGDIRKDFGGTFTHEIRLPDAVERALLCPFHYFGLPDAPGLDFSRLRWQRGGYVREDLEGVLGHNEARASWILDQWRKIATDPSQTRGLGFCVSVAHAEFMANYFRGRGIPAIALHASSPRDLRRKVQHQLEIGELRFIFTVDLYNEGVDLPFVDTLLFLRPTESLTVFLQQLGRGMRLYEGKPHVTVLDFIAPQGRQFRYADRFRALSTQVGRRVDTQIEHGMPYLPSGCLVHLERQARQTVLENIRQQSSMMRATNLRRELLQLAQQLVRRPLLQECLDHLHLDTPDTILKAGLPGVLIGALPETSHHKALAKGLRQLLVCDDLQLLRQWVGLFSVGSTDELSLSLLHSLLWPSQSPGNGTLSEAHAWVKNSAREDVIEILNWHILRTAQRSANCFQATGPLHLQCRYTREQVMLALGLGSYEKPLKFREGVKWVEGREADVFFVTIDKCETDFSPTTLYEDYALTDRLFHWQSQSTTTSSSETGTRYIQHRQRGSQVFLFLRERNKLPNGLTAPFMFAGPMSYRSHTGSKPMSITWELDYPLPARVLSWARRVG